MGSIAAVAEEAERNSIFQNNYDHTQVQQGALNEPLDSRFDFSSSAQGAQKSSEAPPVVMSRFRAHGSSQATQLIQS